jgi:hypothetical protein
MPVLRFRSGGYPVPARMSVEKWIAHLWRVGRHQNVVHIVLEAGLRDECLSVRTWMMLRKTRWEIGAAERASRFIGHSLALRNARGSYDASGYRTKQRANT